MGMTMATTAGAAQPGPSFAYEDPLEEDEAADITRLTSRRGLIRLALVAAETGARFQRDEIEHDPMAWMLAPRAVFGGRAAIDACLEREACLRGVLLHGLGLDLDVSRAMIEALACDEAIGSAPDDGWPRGEDGSHSNLRRHRRMRLYSAVHVFARGGELVSLFHASVAPSASVVRERIRSRFGSTAADHAVIRIGIDPDCSLTEGLLPPAIRELVAGRRRAPRWAELASLDVTVEQRIPS